MYNATHYIFDYAIYFEVQTFFFKTAPHSVFKFTTNGVFVLYAQ